MKLNKLLNILIPILVVILVFVAVFECYMMAMRKEITEQAEIELSHLRMPTDENAIILVDDATADDYYGDEADIFLSYSDFLKNAKRTSHHIGETSVTYRVSRALTAGGANIYLLNFKMRTEVEAAQINVTFGTDHIYNVTTEWRDYYVPCTKGKIDLIKIALTTPFQKVYLSDVNVIRYDPLLVDLHYMKNGSYSVNGIPSYTFSETEGIGVGEVMDVVGDGEYLYSAGNETLKISAISESGTNVVSTLEGIGNIRHMAIRDSKHLAAASRETGVYIVNIEDKTNPYIESFYDSLELANDVCFSGDYMIVADRYFGVEIVDISDISNPVYLTRIENGKECFRCAVEGNYLFVSCWATGEVEIYDISILNEPVLVSTVKVTGRCAEAFVEGNMLYIVSGYSDFVNADDVGDAGYGTGNALTIYDISDIKRPTWHSTIKTEGMLYGNGYDDWSVQVSDGFAYFTNSFGGLYVYDVKNTKAPVSVAHIAVKIPKSSTNYIDFTKSEKTVFPFDAKNEIYSPAMGVHVSDGKVFFACAYNDVYEFDFDGAKSINGESVNFEYTLSEKKTAQKIEEYICLLEDKDVYTIAEHNENYIVATSDGLLLLDTEFNVINNYATEKSVKDVKVASTGVIVTAEMNGVGVYRVDGNQIVRTGFIKTRAKNHAVSSVGVTGDGNYVIAQSSWTKFELIDIHDVHNPLFVEHVISKHGTSISVNAIAVPGNMYYRNIVSGTVNGAVGIGGGGSMVWFESTGEGLRVKNSYPNIFGSETNGSSVMQSGNKILSIYNNGFVIYDPLVTEEGALRKLERSFIPNVRLKGKVSARNNVFVTCNAPSGTIQIVNIDNISDPYLLATYTVENSPGIALIEDDFVLVPIRHGGIMKIDLED